jgi:DNA-directed RNA polymerase specialized sigma subunit
MPRKREIPWDTQTQSRRAQHNADTEYEAIMQTAPHEPIPRSLEELYPLRERLTEAFERLGERDRWIVNSILVERKSIRSTAADLSLAKSHVDRLYKTALGKLRTELENDPLILEYLDND